MLVVLPQLSSYETRNVYLSKAYENLVGFFQKRFGIEIHIISSAEGCIAVPTLEGVKAVQAIHPADMEFFNSHVMLLENQDIVYEDAFAAATANTPLKRGLSIDKRLMDTTAREAAAVNHIARKYYDMVVDFEHPRNTVYHLNPKIAKIYLRVSANMTVEAFLSGKPFDLSSMLQYGGTCEPLGVWDEGEKHYAVS